jgi:Leucine-rich repeat (LRR) protein
MNSCLGCLPLLPNLQVLSLKCTSISSIALEELATKSCPNLIEIDLSFNSFGDHFSNAVIKLINNFTKLNKIDLSADDFTDKFLENNDLVSAIKSDKSFIYLLFIYYLIIKFKTKNFFRF